VARLRWLTLTLIAVWAVLVIYTLAMDFDVSEARTSKELLRRSA